MKVRKSNRHKNFDYSTAWWYFVTICTLNHKNYFGRIVNTKMHFNDFGKATVANWENICQHYQNASLDEYVIMPNHIHGIIIIEYSDSSVLSIKNMDSEFKNPSGKTNLSNIIKGFKIGVTKNSKDFNCGDFKWQRSFYDRIIRDENELYNIRKYIQQNPLKWDLERGITNLDI